MVSSTKRHFLMQSFQSKFIGSNRLTVNPTRPSSASTHQGIFNKRKTSQTVQLSRQKSEDLSYEAMAPRHTEAVQWEDDDITANFTVSHAQEQEPNDEFSEQELVFSNTINNSNHPDMFDSEFWDARHDSVSQAEQYQETQQHPTAMPRYSSSFQNQKNSLNLSRSWDSATIEMHDDEKDPFEFHETTRFKRKSTTEHPRLTLTPGQFDSCFEEPQHDDAFGMELNANAIRKGTIRDGAPKKKSKHIQRDSMHLDEEIENDSRRSGLDFYDSVRFQRNASEDREFENGNDDYLNQNMYQEDGAAFRDARKWGKSHLLGRQHEDRRGDIYDVEKAARSTLDDIFGFDDDHGSCASEGVDKYGFQDSMNDIRRYHREDQAHFITQQEENDYEYGDVGKGQATESCSYSSDTHIG
ncbi:hypothetical protein BJ741DRAFT_260425 [Chytriomyces cf. hyalinus JEL632]|nr:hypothetical protein BJ741DRAFT_260425 [Chytriomyces cf. hyalinus JEL632]